MDINFGIYLTNLLLIMGFVGVVWIFSLIIKDSSIADIIWGLIFTLAAWSTFFQVEGVQSRKILLATLVTLWGVRLALHIGIRNHGSGEDPRYQAFRRNWGDKYWIGSLLQVFLLQGFLGWVISLSVQAGIQSTTPANLTWLAWVGLAIWIFGFLFETIGDWQLTRFKANQDNKGKVMEFGLWRYTRHPNYFGEAVMWWGIFVIVMENTLNIWTVISPLLITYLLLKVSGVSMLERNVVKTRPKYADYQRKTNAFIPWFPKE